MYPVDTEVHWGGGWGQGTPSSLAVQMQTQASAGHRPLGKSLTGSEKHFIQLGDKRNLPPGAENYSKSCQELRILCKHSINSGY